VVAPGSPGLAEIIGTFGEHLLTAEGALERRSLRNLIFSDPVRRRELETILHPLIRADMERRASVARGPYLVMEIPLLIETGGRDRVDRVLVVDVDETVQLKRLLDRDGGTQDEARAILAAQVSRASRLKAADDVIANGGTLSALRDAVDQLHQNYLELAAGLTDQTGRPI
jgi:dephospho-CoA kinase